MLNLQTVLMSRFPFYISAICFWLIVGTVFFMVMDRYF